MKVDLFGSSNSARAAGHRAQGAWARPSPLLLLWGEQLGALLHPQTSLGSAPGSPGMDPGLIFPSYISQLGKPRHAGGKVSRPWVSERWLQELGLEMCPALCLEAEGELLSHIPCLPPLLPATQP